MKKSSGETSFVKHKTRLKPGDPAPYFEGKDQQGRTTGLVSFPGKSIILYFYPKDDTEACTATACSLRDHIKTLSAEDYVVIGVSADDEHSHNKFAKKYGLPFRLIADTGMRIIKDYDVWGSKQLFGRVYDGIVRTTFVIAPNGVIRQVITNVNSKAHAQQILELETGSRDTGSF